MAEAERCELVELLARVCVAACWLVNFVARGGNTVRVIMMMMMMMMMMLLLCLLKLTRNC